MATAAMKSRPINLRPWEARAFQQGRKTRITRVVKHQPPEGSTLYVGNYFPMVVGRDGEQRPATRELYGVWSEDGEYACKSPFGQPGDELWGRETWAPSPFSVDAVVHKAGFEAVDAVLRWRPSIHMPRWASRITLTVTAVRVERLQDISEADAIAEGVERGVIEEMWIDGLRIPRTPAEYRDGFAKQFDIDNGPDSWDANPWVWVVEFERKAVG